MEYAAGFVKRGQVAGIPTDTFYAPSVDPFNLAAIEAVYRAKGRPETKALPILVSSVEQAVTLVRDVPDRFLVLANKFWPGALTLVVEATHRLPLKVTGNTGRVALRWANCEVPTALIEQRAVPSPARARIFGLSFLHECGANREATRRQAAPNPGWRRHWRDARFHNRPHRRRQLDYRARRRNPRRRNRKGASQLIRSSHRSKLHSNYFR